VAGSDQNQKNFGAVIILAIAVSNGFTSFCCSPSLAARAKNVSQFLDFEG
jgi:hypothetical protein